jgi:N-acetylmuramoyl-L-alanine amidase
MYKIYLSGSTQENNIGVSPYGTEELRMQHLADRVKDYLQKGGGDIIVYRNNGSMSLNQIVSDSNSKSPNVHIALHSNSGGGKGTEIYYSNYPLFSSDSKKLAELIYNAVAPLTISSDRGVKADTSLFNSGLMETRDTTAIATLIEIMFHDNYIDVTDYLAKVEMIAKAIAKAIYKYFCMEYRDSIDANERETAIKMIKQVSQWHDVYIREFDILQARGINVWGLICKINKLKV